MIADKVLDQIRCSPYHLWLIAHQFNAECLPTGVLLNSTLCRNNSNIIVAWIDEAEKIVR